MIVELNNTNSGRNFQVQLTNRMVRGFLHQFEARGEFTEDPVSHRSILTLHQGGTWRWRGGDLGGRLVVLGVDLGIKKKKSEIYMNRRQHFAINQARKLNIYYNHAFHLTKPGKTNPMNFFYYTGRVGITFVTSFRLVEISIRHCIDGRAVTRY